MKTNRILASIVTIALTIAASFSAKAVETQKGSDSEASTIYVLNTEDIVKVNTTDVWTVTLKAHTSYRIVVDGDGDTDLDLYVYDENGNLVDDDCDELDYCICSITPKWTGSFKIKVKNLGDVYNCYSIQVYAN